MGPSKGSNGIYGPLRALERQPIRVAPLTGWLTTSDPRRSQMATHNATELTAMLGQHITFTNIFQAGYGLGCGIVSGDVLAVLVPAPGSGVGGSLLVRQDGSQEPEYYDLDEIAISSWSNRSGVGLGA